MQPQSTPASQRISASRSFSTYSASKDDAFIKDELVGSRVRVVEVDSFLAFANLEALWNDSEWDRRCNELKLDKTQTDLKKKWLEIRGGEPNQYPLFCEWVNRLISLLLSEFKLHSPREISFRPLGGTLLPVTPGYADGKEVDGTSSSIKPDSACVLMGEVDDFRKWFQVLVPIEFKKGSLTPSNEERVSAHASTSSSHHLEVPPDTTSSWRRSGSVLEGNEPPAKKVRMSRIRIQSRTSAADTQPKSSSPQSRDPTWDDVQLARYAMETLAAVGDRTHVFGLAVKRPEITLWYFDRGGAVRSQPLNVKEPSSPDFSAFLKFLSALVCMEDDDLGFNSLFAGSRRTKLVKMRRNLSQISIEIPGAGNVSLELQEMLERRAGLVSRATLVYKAQMRIGDEKKDPVVIKSSWQHVQRKSEYDILQELHKNHEASKYVVQAFYGWDGVTVSSKRDKFGDPKPDVIYDRVLRYAVFEHLPPVTELSQPFHIPHIGWSVLQAIKFLQREGWFHRDISIGNIGYRTLSHCQGVIVKLRDFDLSKEIGTSSGTPHWTGTVPFMSIELLENPGTEHKIGFEVEALVWTLLWIVRVFKDGKDKHELPEHPLIDWFSSQLKHRHLANNKKDYLQKVKGFTNDSYQILEQHMRELAREWHKMRGDQLNERDETGKEDLVSENVYGMPGFERIESWMKNHGWNAPKNICSCEEGHCART